jgi:lysozyme
VTSYTTSPSAREMIEGFEGLRLDAYQDSVGVWTIGYGHTPATPGQSITLVQADALMASDLQRFERGLNADLANVTTTQNQFDAMVSFAYNLGLGALEGSTLLRLHKTGDYAGAADEFLKWNHAGGQVLAGLTRRREAEQELYLS